MTIETYQQAAPPAPLPTRLVDWAHEATAANQLAKALCVTQFAPQAFRGKADEATAAILAGSELGLSPMASLNAFDVIQGRPAPRAITLRAVAQSQGHSFRLVKSTDTECVVEAKRRGEPDWQRFAWTIDRARRLGLTSKDQWQKQPQAMLLARATSEAARFVAADALLGVPYAAEELVDETEPSAERTVSRRRPEPVAAAEPDLTPPLEPDPTPEPDGLTDAQQKKLGVLMRERGFDRSQALDYVAGVIGREIGSRTELTKAEASQVIDALSQPAEPTLDDPTLPSDGAT